MRLSELHDSLELEIEQRCNPKGIWSLRSTAAGLGQSKAQCREGVREMMALAV
jgi:hypothetical protein